LVLDVVPVFDAVPVFDVVPALVAVLEVPVLVAPVFFAVDFLGATLASVPEEVAAKAAQPAGRAITRMAARVRKDLVYLKKDWPRMNTNERE
jgi:hypothetical protein